MARGTSGARLVRWTPLAWLAAFFLAPFLIVLKISFSEQATARPPYRPVFEPAAAWDAFLAAMRQLSPANYISVFSDDLIWGAYATSLRIAAISTVLALILGLAIALPMARAPRRWQPWLVTLVVLPFLTSFLIRAYAWIGILKPEGLLNLVLIRAGLISEPVVLLNTEIAVVIGIVYSYLPFMILPLYASLEKFDAGLLEAASDLGARPATVFLLVTVPVIWPAVLAGCALVFIPALGEFVIPDLLGGSDTLMVGRVVWNAFFADRDWPLASAMAVLLLAIALVPILIRQARTS